MKLCFIGYGNMAAAIAGGILAKGLYLPGEIAIFDPSEQRKMLARDLGLSIISDIKNEIDDVDTIILSVKPKTFPDIMRLLSGVTLSGKTIISIAAGITLDYMETHLGKSTALVRAMPNTPLLLGKGTTALCRNEHVNDEAFALAQDIFASAGTVYLLPETAMNHVINLNGSSPAYLYLFAQTVADFAAEQGSIPYDTALNMFCDTMCGAAAMLRESGQAPEDLIRMVSSPGGTTIAALKAFDEGGFTTAITAGLSAAVRRAEEMGRENV